MKISEENQKNGWTPELVEWAQKYPTGSFTLAENVNRTICLMRQSVCGKLPLKSLEKTRPAWCDLLQSLPAKALEILPADGKWAAAVTLTGERWVGMSYRVRAGWQVGEWVEDGPELAGGALLDKIIEDQGLPLALTISGKMCFLHNDCQGFVRLSWDGGHAHRNSGGWVYLETLCDSAEITRDNVSVG